MLWKLMDAWMKFTFVIITGNPGYRFIPNELHVTVLLIGKKPNELLWHVCVSLVGNAPV